MDLPWHLSLEGLEKDRRRSATQPSLLAHYCALDVDRPPGDEPRTGVMCHLGADAADGALVRRLMAAGLTVARLDLPRLEPELCAQLLQSVRRAVLEYSADLGFVYPLAVAADVRGPDILTGGLAGGPRPTVRLVEGASVKLTADVAWRDCGTAECLYVGWDHLTELEPGDRLQIDGFGAERVELEVTDVGEDSIECAVTEGGAIGSRMGVRVRQLPRDVAESGSQPSAESVDSDASKHSLEHVERQIAWACSNDVDFVILPGVQSARDVKQVRGVLGERGEPMLVVACIETMSALDNVDEILEEADGLYLDRSVLSADLPIEKVFIAQKTIVAKCNRRGKPCICKAVINEQIPTLCVSDMATLVLDGVDVISLELHYDRKSGAEGPRAAEHCLAAASVVCRQAERVAYEPLVYGNLELMQSPLEEPSRAVCVGAVELAMRSRAVAVVCLTTSGRSAKLVAHARAPCPIVAVTRSCRTARQLRLWRGVRSLHYTEAPLAAWACEAAARAAAALRYLAARGALRAGDAYVLLAASRRGVGYTDTVRLAYALQRSDYMPTLCRLWRGVRSLHYTEAPLAAWACEAAARAAAALRYLAARGALRAGDAYVLLAASRRGVGYTDTVRLAYANAADATLIE